MQMLQGNASPAASGKWGPAPHCRQHGGAHPEGKIIPMGHPVPHAQLGPMPVFLATGTCHHAQGGVGYRLHPLFSSKRATQLLLCLPFLALGSRDWEILFLQGTQRTEPGRRILSVIPFTFPSLSALRSTGPCRDLCTSSCRFHLKWSNCVHCGRAMDPPGNSPCLVGAGQLFVGIRVHRGSSGN